MMDELIQTMAKRFHLDPLWIKAIILQESGGNPWALRYEKNYSYLFQPKIFAKHHLISLDTEIETQKMSWGLGQLMGALARQQGHTGLMAELVQPELNIKHICIRFQDLKTISQVKDDLFAMYNGGPGALKHLVNGKYPNQSYVLAVNLHLQSLQKS